MTGIMASTRKGSKTFYRAVHRIQRERNCDFTAAKKFYFDQKNGVNGAPSAEQISSTVLLAAAALLRVAGNPGDASRALDVAKMVRT